MSNHKLLWLAARIAALITACVLAIVFVSSWLVALIVGGLTIAAVAADGLLLARGQTSRIAIDPLTDSGPRSRERLTVDLRRRR